MSQPDEAVPEEVPRHPPREAWPLARVLGLVLMKMGRAGPPLSHAAGRRQASLGTPIPKTPTNTHGVLVLIMFCLWKRLSQRVCNIQIRMYLANLYVSLYDLTADGIEASLDVLGSLVKSGFLCQGNCTSIVTEDLHWS